ncbi:MAG: S1 family peptidase [Frankiaceae bacterium]
MLLFVSSVRRRVTRWGPVVALTLAALCTHAVPAFAVANGKPVPNGRYPFAVKLTMTAIPRPDGTSYDSACSGALVAKWWIITAGHCFHDVNRTPVSGNVPYATTATIGRTDVTDSTGVVVSVTRVVQSGTHDVALAKLARPVNDVKPLSIDRYPPRLGEIVTLAGWGSTTDVNPIPSPHLQSGQFRISSITAATVGVVGYRPSSNTSACLYDSGAPYFTTTQHRGLALVAVESTGPACPHTTEETTSRVDNLASWIHCVIYGRKQLALPPGAEDSQRGSVHSGVGYGPAGTRAS